MPNPSEETQSPPGFGEQQSYESGFVNTPFSYSAGPIQDTYFSSYQEDRYGQTSIIYDSDVSQPLWNDLSNGVSNLSDHVIVENQVYQLNTKIFISKNESKLQRAYDDAQPLDHEVCLFLEDNTGDLLSSRSYYMKIGRIYQQYLEEKKNNGDLSSYTVNPIKEIIKDNNDQSLQLDFTEAELDELITKGSITHNVSALTYAGIRLLSIGIRNAGPIYGLIARGIFFVTEGIKSNIKFKPESWDPEFERTDESQFSPALFPFVPDLSSEEGIISRFTSTLTSHKEENVEYLDRLSTIDFSSLPSVFQTFGAAFQRVVTKIKQLYDSFTTFIIRNLNDMMQFFAKVGSKIINILNAYYCGIWNSLVDSILGIPEIIGFVFKGLELAGQAAENIDTLFPKVKETLDEAIQLAFTTDWEGMFSGLLSSLGAGLASLTSTAVGFISVEKFFYYLGAIAGFVIEMVIGFLVSAGIINVASISSKIGQLGKLGKLIEFTIQMIMKVNQAVDLVAGTILDSLFKVIGYIFSILRKGKEEIVRMVSALFRGIDELATVADGLISAFFERIGLNLSDMGALRAYGVEVIDVNLENGVAKIIQNCR